MNVDLGAATLHLPFPGVIRRQEINSRLFVSFELYGGRRELLQGLISHTRFVQLFAVLVDPLQLVPRMNMASMRSYRPGIAAQSCGSPSAPAFSFRAMRSTARASLARSRQCCRASQRVYHRWSLKGSGLHA